jgi:acetyl-CoA carboxylase alpha subunit
MSDLPTPVVAAIIGEANSEGLLAFGMADRTLMLENAIYSPALASDGLDVEQNRNEAYLGANDCRELGLVDEIVYEPSGGAHTDHQEAARLLKGAILRHLAELQPQPIRRVVALRYQRFRDFGHYSNIRSAISQPVGKIRRRFVDGARGALARIFPPLKQRPPDDSEDIAIP